ncbi:MAG TPA: indole-3-glycerol phosphate synthase TrpC, partial [Stellaceae bacterium]|nr:indole-3-glycerol phosphate synthase TrpC [Stellaceae bacterium]
MSDTLASICATTREAVKRAKSARPLAAIERAAADATAPRGFIAALERRVEAGGYGLIAEIKKASPSAGLIRPDFDPPALARAYQQGGAACLSVLTEAANFLGSGEHLEAARDAVELPVLRKDFMLDPYQVTEARAWGADCVLLILAVLTDDEAHALEGAAM